MRETGRGETRRGEELISGKVRGNREIMMNKQNEGKSEEQEKGDRLSE